MFDLSAFLKHEKIDQDSSSSPFRLKGALTTRETIDLKWVDFAGSVVLNLP